MSALNLHLKTGANWALNMVLFDALVLMLLNSSQTPPVKKSAVSASIF
jgi:hypothetical protein